MRNTFYKNDNSNNLVNTKKSYKFNYEQKVYPKGFFDQFMLILNKILREMNFQKMFDIY